MKRTQKKKKTCDTQLSVTPQAFFNMHLHFSKNMIEPVYMRVGRVLAKQAICLSKGYHRAAWIAKALLHR